VAVVLVPVLVVVLPVKAGHEALVQPSYYPQEIRIESVAPAAAAELLARAAMHVFIGGDLFTGRTTPSNVTSVQSLGSYVVVTLNTTGWLNDRERRCALAQRIVTILARDHRRYIFHPYPVTPYHMDYLEYFDLAEVSRQSVLAGTGHAEQSRSAEVAVGAQGALAEALVRPHWATKATGWDARVETIDVAELLAAHDVNFAGWLGPPWLKAGWFNAYLLLAERVADQRVKEEVTQRYRRLVTGDYRSVEEKITLERALVTLLRQGCERVVVGYTLRSAYFNVDYSQGVENVAYDSHSGANSPIFVRTVKLKDFPWNGRVRIGLVGKAIAAWNPISGFRDAFGRLLWAAVGDPGLLPTPYAGSWIPNRVVPRIVHDDSWLGRLRAFLRVPAGSSEKIEVPADALIPQRSGLLERVGPGKWASAKVEYRVLASSFHDGTTMTVADVLYPYILAYLSGHRTPQHGWMLSRSIERSTALMRQHLVGIKVLRTETVARNFGPALQLKYDVLVIVVYVNNTSPDPQYLADIALPWSTVPWHLMVLMQEAVIQGYAAFSEDEAVQRGVPWLDLVRARPTTERLVRLLDDFESRSYVPDALRGLVTREEATRRWRALREFFQRHGHLLVTNGPYRLQQWSDHGVLLEAFRSLSYPLGLGSFDKYARPRRAYITRLSVQGTRLEVQADVERVIRFERSYKIVRERLGSNTSGAIDQVDPLCRYLVVGGDGRVVKVATASYGNDGVYTAELPGARDTGRFTVIIGMYLNENMMTPDVKLLRY